VLEGAEGADEEEEGEEAGEEGALVGVRVVGGEGARVVL